MHQYIGGYINRLSSYYYIEKYDCLNLTYVFHFLTNKNRGDSDSSFYISDFIMGGIKPDDYNNIIYIFIRYMIIKYCSNDIYDFYYCTNYYHYFYDKIIIKIIFNYVDNNFDDFTEWVKEYYDEESSFNEEIIDIFYTRFKDILDNLDKDIKLELRNTSFWNVLKENK
jgi:hypothetical protein